MLNIKAFLGLVKYTSPLDAFLNDFDQNNPHLSFSQRKEINNQKRIAALRDEK